MGERPSPGSLLFALGLLAAGAGGTTRAEEAPAHPALPVPRACAAAPEDALRVGEFALAEDPVVDGDTIRLATPRENVRVLCVDTEEIAHGGSKPPEGGAEFAAFAAARRAGSPLPVKFATPLGEAARARVRELLAGRRTVRLERDEPDRDRDGFGRRLAHVILVRDGEETLLSETLIREGLSPYFVKYGRSRRFDERLARAEASARAAHRGIWSPDRAHYPDYEERLAWWEDRARQVDDWLRRVAADPLRRDRIRLGGTDTPARLAEFSGRPVTVFGSLDRVEAGGVVWPGRATERRPAAPRPPPAPGTLRRIFLVDQPHAPLAVVVDPAADGVWDALPFPALARRFVRVTGVVRPAGRGFEILLLDARGVATE